MCVDSKRKRSVYECLIKEMENEITNSSVLDLGAVIREYALDFIEIGYENGRESFAEAEYLNNM